MKNFVIYRSYARSGIGALADNASCGKIRSLSSADFGTLFILTEAFIPSKACDSGYCSSLRDHNGPSS